MATLVEETKNLPIVPVILAGGAGTRLWPLSRQAYPKQFLALVGAGEQTLLQQTLLRLKLPDFLDTKPPIVVAHEEHRFLLLDQLHSIKKSAQIILEPIGKNTAPSLTLAALHALDNNKDAILVVLPADHAIQDEQDFNTTLQAAIGLIEVSDNTVVTLGVVPTHAETGYGYIHIGQQLTDGYQVKRFVEKPDKATAESYLASGDYFWNAGIFVLKASTWLQAMQQFATQSLKQLTQSWQQGDFDNPFYRPDSAIFAQLAADSIDYAVLEHLPSDDIALAMVPLNSSWNDLGSWHSVAKEQDKDKNDNTLIGDIISQDSHHCYVQSGQRLVALLGVQDLVVIDTTDALLIANKNDCQHIKGIVECLNDNQRSEAITHRKVHRPWGWYDSIDEEERFKVKRICVQPKASLSLQKHHHRAEHWIVVSGTAEVTCDDKTFLLTENQSTYIPLGKTHRLSNPGNIPLEIIEVQSGSYLEEDDIVRLDDDYGRG